MEITKVNITLNRKYDNKLKAYANIVIDGCFIVRGLKVIDGEKGMWVAMPGIKNGQDIAHPLNNETRIMIEDAVLDVYELVLNKVQQNREKRAEPQIEYGR